MYGCPRRQLPRCAAADARLGPACSLKHQPLPAPAGQPSGSLQFCVAACDNHIGAIVIDPIALGAIILLTLVMVFGVKESFWFNVGTVAISVVAILFCILAGEPAAG